jgi:hypothetical protein
MHLEAGGALVIVKCRAANLSTKVKKTLCIKEMVKYNYEKQ